MWKRLFSVRKRSVGRISLIKYGQAGAFKIPYRLFDVINGGIRRSVGYAKTLPDRPMISIWTNLCLLLGQKSSFKCVM